MWLFADAIMDQLLKWVVNPSGASFVALLALISLALYRGWLIPKPQYDEVVKERDALRAKSDALLEAYQKREEMERIARLGQRISMADGGKV